MIQRIALYATVGFLLNSIGIAYDHWGFWCLSALVYAAEVMGARDGYSVGFVSGIECYPTLSIQQREDISRILKDKK